MSTTTKIRTGDHVEVTPMERDLRTHRDFGTIRGTAMNDLGLSGSPKLKVQLTINGFLEPPMLEFDVNYVEVRKLFSAGVARHMQATTSLGLPVPQPNK